MLAMTRDNEWLGIAVVILVFVVPTICEVLALLYRRLRAYGVDRRYRKHVRELSTRLGEIDVAFYTQAEQSLDDFARRYEADVKAFEIGRVDLQEHVDRLNAAQRASRSPGRHSGMHRDRKHLPTRRWR